MKECITCKKTKDFSEFMVRKDSKDGHRNECKECCLDYTRKWHNGEIIKAEYKDGDGKKQCRSCLEILAISNFGKSKQNKDGLKSYCNICKAKESAEWREDNIGYYKKYQEENKEELAVKKKIYQEENKEVIAEKSKKRREANKEVLAEKHKVYYEKNKQHIIDHKQNRRHTDIQFKLAESLRVRLHSAIRGKTKRGSAVSDLGCTIPELKEHLEALFWPGMTWNNYGKWHIDHIMPLVSFDLTDRAQLLQACHYTNLQPLWAADNLSKGSKVPNKE